MQGLAEVEGPAYERRMSPTGDDSCPDIPTVSDDRECEDT